MVEVYVKFALIFCVSGCFGFLTGENLDPGGNQYRQPQDLVTFVYQKIESMERLLTEKDERVDRLESILTNQKTEISQLNRGMTSLEQEILHKDGIVDRLVKRVTDLEMIVIMAPISQEPESQQHQNINRHSTTLPNDVLDQFQSPINETTSLRQSVRSLLSGNETRAYSLRRGKRTHSPSRTGNMNDSTVSQQVIGQTENEADDVSRATFPRIQQKRVAPPSQTPKQRVAFHVASSGDKVYHEDNTVVYDNEKLDHGNGYNPVDGIYTAPESGTYVLTWTSICGVHQQFQTVLAVNGAYMGSSFTDATFVNDNHQSTAVVVITLNKGDLVFIRFGSTYSSGILMTRLDGGESTFSGWQLD